MIDIVAIKNHLDQVFNQSVIVIDDHKKHQSHQSFQSKKAYITVIIENKEHLPRIQFHKKVYQAVEMICDIPIHALHIQCLKPNELSQ